MRTKSFAWGTLFLLLGLPVFGQTFGEITGEVRDSSGAIIGGAAITVTNVATNATRSATSNDAGVYSFPSIPPGIYNLKAEKAGFKVVTRNQVEIF